MALSIPVTKTVRVTAAKNYVLTIALCNTNVSSSFVASAVPVFASSLSGRGFESAYATATSRLTFAPGSQLQYVTTRKTASTSSATLYPVFSSRSPVSLSCSRSGTAVNVLIPFGANYQSVSADPTDLQNSPTRYALFVNYGDSSGRLIVNGGVEINIQQSTATSEFSVCSVSVT